MVLAENYNTHKPNRKNQIFFSSGEGAASNDAAINGEILIKYKTASTTIQKKDYLDLGH